MRHYKFRAFNKASQIMYYPECTQDEYNHYLQVGAGGFWLYNKEGKLICTSNKGDVLMEHIGLKDSTGKDIYESDKVNDRVNNCVVEWDCRNAKYNLAIIYDDAPEGICQTHKPFPLDAYSLTVIGNVYDKLNPAKGAVINTMNIYDPKEPAEEVKAPATETEQGQVPAPTEGEGTQEETE